MGNYCCQELNHTGQIQADLFTDAKFKPITHVPEIANPIVRQRIIELSSDKLDIDDSKYQGIKLRGAQKQLTKDYIYEGTWRDDIPQGRGSITFHNNEFFQGEFKDGVAQGKGRFIMSKGDYYTGDIANNKANGRGKYVGQEYDFDGQWIDSKPTIGKYTMKSTGTIITITKPNNGTIEWVDRNYYTGEIENQNPNGTGKMQFHNKNVYEGQWKNGTFHGHGEYHFASGQKYIGIIEINLGDYENGIKHGTGIFYYLNNRRYEGDWRNGKQNGRGKLVMNGQTVYEGTFKDGEPFQVEDEEIGGLSRDKKISYQNESFLNKDSNV